MQLQIDACRVAGVNENLANLLLASADETEEFLALAACFRPARSPRA